LPLDELQALQARREAAAATIQAHWRGAQQRQRMRATMPAFVSRIAGQMAGAWALSCGPCVSCHTQQVISAIGAVA
jgi:type VI protein secretion system component VasF